MLTTDADYRPHIKERPRSHTWEILQSYREGIPAGLEPLAKKTSDFDMPDRHYGDH